MGNSRDLFVQEIFKLASEMAAAGRKINPAIVTAQAILESRYGESGLSRKANNLFGIKASKTWKGEVFNVETTEYDKDEKQYKIVAGFCKYPNWKASLEDYAMRIETRSWYADAAANCKDHLAYLKGICPRNGEPGWATDPQYSNKILSLVNRYKLVPR